MRNCIICIIFPRIFLKVSVNRFKLLQRRGHLRILYFFTSFHFAVEGGERDFLLVEGSHRLCKTLVCKEIQAQLSWIILYEEVVINLKAVARFPSFYSPLCFLACSLIALAIKTSLVYVRRKFHCLWEAGFGYWLGGSLCVPSSSCSL